MAPLACAAARAPVAQGFAPPRLQVHGAQDAGRAEVEQFIGGVFTRRFGARVPGFAPALVSLTDPADGSIVAAAGFRAAAAGTLFLEQYLAAPVEAVLAQHARTAPARAAIVEIGHLAASRAGAGRRLMIQLGPLLEQHGFRWIVCTLTQELRHLLPRLGITPLALAPARPAALGAQAAAWGSYYDHQPVVLAGELAPALRRFRQRLAAGGEPA